MKNFTNMAKEIDFWEVQEAQRVPKKLDPRRNTPRHIIITLGKITQKERILEAAREKDTVTYKGVPIRLSADFSKETLQARTNWEESLLIRRLGVWRGRQIYRCSVDKEYSCFALFLSM